MTESKLRIIFRNNGFLFIGLSILSLFSGCNLNHWELPKLDISNFEKIFFDNSLTQKQNIKLDNIYQNDEFYILFNNTNNNQGLLFINKNGIVDSITTYSNVSTNNIHSFLKIDSFLIFVSNFTKSSQIYKTFFNEDSIIKVFDPFDFVNLKIGLLDSLYIYDILTSKNNTDGIYLVGFIQQTIGKKRSFIIKTDNNLNPLWVKTLMYKTEVYKIQIGMNNEIFLMGRDSSNTILVKFNEHDSNFKFHRILNSSNKSLGSFQLDANNIYILTNFNNGNSYEAKIIKMDFNFNNIWQTENQFSNMLGNVLILNNKGNLIASFYDLNSHTLHLSEITNDSGNILWCNSFKASFYEQPLFIKQTNDMGYLSVNLFSEDSVNYYYHLIKTDNEGATRQSPYSEKCN